jgi:tol-pal system protein YbgF
MDDRMKKPLFLALALAGALGGANAAWSQADPLTDPLPRTLGERDDRRLDRVEQTLREMRAILFQGRDTGRAVVVQPANTQAEVELLSRRVDDLEATLERVNGQIDQVSTDVAALRRDNARQAQEARTAADVNTQVLKRLETIEKQLAEAAQARVAAEQAIAADPEAAFDRAMQMFVDGQYRPAASAFQAFLDNHPESEDAPEARYYLGEALFKQAAYNDAAISYLASIRDWPQTSWAPDAVVKLSMSLIETDRTGEACSILGEFGKRYPKAPNSVKTQANAARRTAKCG